MKSKDDNNVQPLYGVSHLDGVTPVQIKFDSLRGMMVDIATSIAFDPTINAARTFNDLPFAEATSSSDNILVRPWVVNAANGAVLIDNV